MDKAKFLTCDPEAFVFDTTEWEERDRTDFLKRAWQCHCSAYGENRAWKWDHFVEKSFAYPVFAVLLNSGEVMGMAQWSQGKTSQTLVNLGSIGVRNQGLGHGKILAGTLFQYCESRGFRLLLEILVEEVDKFRQLFGKTAFLEPVKEKSKVVEMLETVQGRPMKDRIQNAPTFDGGAYLRYSQRRGTWEQRILLMTKPLANRRASPVKKKNTNRHRTWPPPSKRLGEITAKYLAHGGSLSIAGRSGPVLKLEQWFEREHPNRHALSFSSGTMALQAAFFAAGLKPGDRVAATVYSYHATVTPLLQYGVHIDFVDVEKETGNLCPEALAKTLRSEHKLLVTNHMWGHPVDVEAIRGVLSAKAAECLWVEDCSHALFAEYKGRRVGTFGDLAVISLQANKILPAGEGGILLVSDALLHDRASSFAYSLERTATALLTENYRALARTGFGLKHRIHPLGALIALYYARHHLDSWIHGRSYAHNAVQKTLAGSTLFEPMTIRPYVTHMGAWYGMKPQLKKGNISTKMICAAAKYLDLDISKPGSGRMNELALFTENRYLKDTLNNSTNLTGEHSFPGASAYLEGRLSFPTFHQAPPNADLDIFLDGLGKLESAFGEGHNP